MLILSLSQTQARLLPRRIAREGERESHPLLKRKSPRVPPPPRSAKPHLIDFPPRCCRRRSGWLAGCFPPSPLTSSFPFCRSSPRSTSASRFFLPFGRLLSLSLSPAQMKGAALSFFLPPSLQHFPLSCSHFSRAKEEAKWEMGVQKCAGGGREASDSRREGLDKQTCAVSERTAVQIPQRRSRLFSLPFRASTSSLSFTHSVIVVSGF